MTIIEELNKFPSHSNDHLLTVRNRKRIDMTSIKTINRFDQEEFAIATAQGPIIIRGEQLKIVHLDVDKGLLTLEGIIKGIQYDQDEEEREGKGLLNKLFG